jgi:cytoskeletal protein CcmA (bactofilin family)
MPNEPKPSDERRTNAWIGQALRIEGRVTSRENLTIDGEVEGTIELGEHNLTIGRGAMVTADLAAKTITVSGTVTGNVVVTDSLDLQPTGSVTGDVVAPRLSMADGAVILGRVDVKGTKKEKPA